jgi:hypothetical protein
VQPPKVIERDNCRYFYGSVAGSDFVKPKPDGDHMKRKNDIPDFSKKKKNSQPHSVPDNTKIPQHVPTPPVVRADKPPATSMKSGRRGS